MSSISSISSLVSQYLLGTDGSTTTDLTDPLTGSSDTSLTDTLTLSDASQSALSSLLSSLGGTSSSADDSSSSSMYDLLISAANTKLVKSSPALVNMVLAVQDAEESDSDSSSTSSSADDIDLISMSASDLLSIIQKYKTLSSTTTSSTSIDEMV
ncbi:MAG: hypothetical protein ABFD81_19775 [Syntrophaceae bacterium]